MESHFVATFLAGIGRAGCGGVLKSVDVEAGSLDWRLPVKDLFISGSDLHLYLKDGG